MSNIATGIDTQEFETTGYITGNDSIKLLLSGLAKDSLEPFFQRCKTLQNTLRSDIKTNSQVLTDIENEWHDITMPVNISHPGMYRVTNDYSATKDEIGISVICDDVIIDGNGHTFRGLPGHECVGFAAISDTILKNISITNFSTRECYGGIVMLHVQGCTISDTHNTGTLAGISIGSSENVTVSRNTIQDYSVESSASELYGIASMDVSGIRLEGNHISNISPSTEGIISSGIYLSNTRDISCVHNDISGPISVGIIIEPALFSSGGYFDISDNKVCSYDMFGIFVGGGYGYVTNNSVEQGTNGIMLTMDDSSIVNNRISDNLQRGLEFSGTNNTLSQNILTNNTCNLNIEGFREEDYLHHIDRTNLINGKPFIYIRDSSNVTIGPEDNPAAVLSVRCQNITIHDITTGYNKAGIMLINGTNISISHVHDTGSMSGYLTSNVRGCRITDSVSTDNKIYGFIIRDGEDYSLKQCRTAGTSGTGFYVLNSKDITLDTCFINSFSSDYLEEDAYGTYFDYSTNITIQNSTFSNSPFSGIFGTNTEELVIINSTMEKNQEYGISLMQCNQVSINDSIISQNEGSGIAMDFLSRFTIYQNILSGNHKYGLLLLDVSEGIVTNNLFNNTKNMEFVYGSSPLTWNTTLTPGKNIVNGPNLGGNFWANPQGQGFSQTHGDRGDGICNASYILNDENIDFLPLAIPSEEITPNFIADQVSGTPPLTVRFIDISTGNPSSWNWTFGDGTISHEQNPIHIYTGTGRYSVTLEVTGEDGKQGILRRPTLIIVNPGRITGPIGIFQVDSLPQNGSVFLDGGWIGYTPLKPSGIPAGTHQIKITREGFRDWSGKVMINQGQFTIVPTIKLQPI